MTNPGIRVWIPSQNELCKLHPACYFTGVTDQVSDKRSGSRLALIPREDGPLAQSAEHLPFKQRVAGSSPARLTNQINNLQETIKTQNRLGVTSG
jgi:hypothetical protein